MKSTRLILILTNIIVAILISGPVQAKDSPFGIGTFLSWNHSWNNYMYPGQEEIEKTVALLKQLGISMIRNEFSWNEIETKKDLFEFERYDYIVKTCKDNNIEITGILGYSPAWTGRKWNESPADEQLFLNYVKVVVSRYKNEIRYWEFWNEPDSVIYWSPQDNMKKYTALLKKVYTVIKKANPSATVLLGGLTNNPYYSFKRVLSNGGGDYFDIINIHPYFNPETESAAQKISMLLERIDKEMEKRNINKKIWITEIACPGSEKPEKCSWWLGACSNENEQADFLKEIYTLPDKHKNLEKIFWSMFRDTDHFKDGIDNFGIIRWDYTPKPAYSAYKQIIEQYEQNFKKQSGNRKNLVDY
jgi:hypothetical protein